MLHHHHQDLPFLSLSPRVMNDNVESSTRPRAAIIIREFFMNLELSLIVRHNVFRMRKHTHTYIEMWKEKRKGLRKVMLIEVDADLIGERCFALLSYCSIISIQKKRKKKTNCTRHFRLCTFWNLVYIFFNVSWNVV